MYLSGERRSELFGAAYSATCTHVKITWVDGTFCGLTLRRVVACKIELLDCDSRSLKNFFLVDCCFQIHHEVHVAELKTISCNWNPFIAQIR